MLHLLSATFTLITYNLITETSPWMIHQRRGSRASDVWWSAVEPELNPPTFHRKTFPPALPPESLPWSCFQDWAPPFGASLNVKLVIHDPITFEFSTQQCTATLSLSIKRSRSVSAGSHHQDMISLLITQITHVGVKHSNFPEETLTWKRHWCSCSTTSAFLTLTEQCHRNWNGMEESSGVSHCCEALLTEENMDILDCCRLQMFSSALYNHVPCNTETQKHLQPPLSLRGLPGGCCHHCGCRGRVGGGRYRGSRFDPPTLHEREQLVRDLCQDVLCQSGHAQDLVPRAVDVVSERNELGKNRETWCLRIFSTCWYVYNKFVVKFTG